MNEVVWAGVVVAHCGLWFLFGRRWEATFPSTGREWWWRERFWHARPAAPPAVREETP